MKQRIISIIQLILGLAILALIFSRLHHSGQTEKLLEALQQASGNIPMIIAAIAVIGGCLLVCTLRWQLILIAQELKIHYGRVVSIFFVGHFFNAFIFGSTGGDVVKAYYVATETDSRRTEAVSTVFIDRIIGLIALLILVGIVTLLRLRYFLSYPETRIAMFFNLGVLVCLAGGLVLVFSHNILDRWTYFRKLRERTSLGDILARIYDAFHICLRHPRLLMQTLAISIVNHLFMVLSGYFLGRALGFPLGYLDYLTVIPIITLVSAIPITPAGIGTRETAAMFLLATMGISEARAVTFSLLIFAVTTVWSLFGGLVYAGYVFSRGTAKMNAEPSE